MSDSGPGASAGVAAILLRAEEGGGGPTQGRKETELLRLATSAAAFLVSSSPAQVPEIEASKALKNSSCRISCPRGGSEQRTLRLCPTAIAPKKLQIHDSRLAFVSKPESLEDRYAVRVRAAETQF